MKFGAIHSRPRLMMLDLTAMVDLVFLLIIFFLTTSTFIERNKARLELPSDPTVDRQDVPLTDRSSMTVNLTKNGTIVVSQEYLTLDELVAKIKVEMTKAGEDATKLDVLMRADRETPLRFVNQVAERLIDAGVERWKIAMEVGVDRTNGGGS